MRLERSDRKVHNLLKHLHTVTDGHYNKQKGHLGTWSKPTPPKTRSSYTNIWRSTTVCRSVSVYLKIDARTRNEQLTSENQEKAGNTRERDLASFFCLRLGASSVCWVRWRLRETRWNWVYDDVDEEIPAAKSRHIPSPPTPKICPSP